MEVLLKSFSGPSLKLPAGLWAVLHYMSQYSFCWDSVGMDIKDLESVGMDPNRSAPLRASTSPPPPLAYFQHIKLSVPKRKI